MSDGCTGCYAEALMDKRMGRVQWGAGQPRQRTSESYWRQPLAWDRKARKSGQPWRVFCGSLCDVLDNEVPEKWREDLFYLIAQTPHLTWMFLTKRIGNAAAMIPRPWTGLNEFPPNVWIGATVVNQEEADRDVPKLLALPAAVRFLSIEPMLEPIDLTRWLDPTGVSCPDICDDLRYVVDGEVETFKRGKEVIPLCPHCGEVATWTGYDPGIDWVIVGGESDQPGHKARPFVCGWGKDIVRQCKAAGVPVFVKQIGDNATNREGEPHPTTARAGGDPNEWPEDLRVREFPR